jgi:hypothetical protein
MAPGGEGGPPLATVTPVAPLANPPCYPQFETPPCPNPPASADCAFGVTSFVVDHHVGMAFWAGTSFAAPIVSGLAARELEAGVAPQDVLSQTISSTVSSGIVNVAQAMP